LSIITGVVLGGIAAVTAPVLADAFNEPRASLVIQVLSLRLVIGGFENIGVALLRRELNFRKDYLFGFVTKAVAVLATIALAWTFRNYWALVIGSICQAVIALVASYRVHPYRPALCFSGLGRILRFSSHVFLAAVGNQLGQRVDRIFLGRFLEVHAVGIYHVGAELGRISTYDLVEPTARALFPNYARAEGGQLRTRFLDAFSGVAMLAIGAAAGFACVAEPAIRLLYGAAWAEAAPIAGWIAISSAILAISNTAAPVQAVTGHTKTMVAQAWVRLGLFVLIAATLAPLGFTASDAAQWRVAAAAMAAPMFAWGVSRAVGVGIGDLLSRLWRPLAGAFAMTLALQGVQGLGGVHNLPLPLSLGLQVLLGLTVYAASVLVLWLIAGRPDSVEAWLLGAVKKVYPSRHRGTDTVEHGTGPVSASTTVRFR
jgi:O-antigen/teichoic acid export membrane protein